jgi:putative copper export protein
VSVLGLGDAALILAKAATYAATLCAAGAVGFCCYSRDLLVPAEERRIRRLIHSCLLAAALASAAMFPAAAAAMSGAASSLIDLGLMRLIWDSGAGTEAAVRLLGLVLMLVPVARGAAQAVPLAGAGLAATSFAWMGHVQALPGRWAAPVLGLHLVAVAFWLGALGPLALLAGARDPQRTARAAARFGALALAGVAVLAAAGTLLLCRLLRSPAELWSTPYGRWFSGKLAAVTGLLALAALNHWRLTPAMAAGEAQALRGFRQSLRAELAAAAAVLLITAAMTTLTGPAALE